MSRVIVGVPMLPSTAPSPPIPPRPTYAAFLLNTNTQNINNVSVLPILYNTVVFDVAGNLASIANNGFIIPVSGMYSITGSMAWNTSAINHLVRIWIRVNGNPFFEYQNGNSQFRQSNQTWDQFISRMVRLVAGDIITIGLSQNGASSQPILANATAGCVYLGGLA